MKYQGAWPWPNFKPSEIACDGEDDYNLEKYGKPCGCGAELWKPKHGLIMPPDLREALDKIQAFRDDWGKPISFNSAHRCVFHNKRVGGGTKSQHLTIAFDCRCPDHPVVLLMNSRTLSLLQRKSALPASVCMTLLYILTLAVNAHGRMIRCGTSGCDRSFRHELARITPDRRGVPSAFVRLAVEHD